MWERFKETIEKVLDRVDELAPGASVDELCSLGRMAMDIGTQVHYLENPPATGNAPVENEAVNKPVTEIIAKPEHDKVDDDPFAIDEKAAPTAEIVSNDIDTLRARLDALKASKGGKGGK